MARRRRPEPVHEPDAVADGDPIAPHERVDPRVTLSAPDDVARDPDDLLAWAARHAPRDVLSDEQILARRDTRERQRAYQQAAREARRRGLPAPHRREFFDDYVGL